LNRRTSERPAQKSGPFFWRGRSGLDVERVTGRADGADQVHLPIAVERLAQAADMNVDGAGVDFRIVSPDRVEQPLAREHPARVFEEMLEQPKLGRAKRHLLAAAANAMGGHVHFDVRISELLSGE